MMEANVMGDAERYQRRSGAWARLQLEVNQHSHSNDASHSLFGSRG